MATTAPASVPSSLMRRCVPLVVLLILALAAAPPSVAARRPPVIVVVFDEFPVDSLLRPDGRIDAARYPGFGRLANRATWFPNAFSVQDRTGAALPAILDGRLPRRGTRPTAAEHPQNLFTLLAGHGYGVETSEPVSALCPRAICLDPIVQAPGPNSLFLSQRVTRFRTALRSIRRTRRPLLLFHHQILPHQPWERLPSGRRYRTDPGSVGPRPLQRARLPRRLPDQPEPAATPAPGGLRGPGDRPAARSPRAGSPLETCAAGGHGRPRHRVRRGRARPPRDQSREHRRGRAGPALRQGARAAPGPGGSDLRAHRGRGPDDRRPAEAAAALADGRAIGVPAPRRCTRCASRSST